VRNVSFISSNEAAPTKVSRFQVIRFFFAFGVASVQGSPALGW
jgi:hypothetical protein